MAHYFLKVIHRTLELGSISFLGFEHPQTEIGLYTLSEHTQLLLTT
jgi:hypothetical protein